MKCLPFISRNSGATARCLDGAVASKLPTANSCHRVVPARSNTATRFLRAETSRHHTVQASHRAATSRHGIATDFLYTETYRHHTATAAFTHRNLSSPHRPRLSPRRRRFPPHGNLVATHRNFISPRGKIIFTHRKSIFIRREIVRRLCFGAKTGQKRHKPRVLSFPLQTLKYKIHHENKLRSRK